MSQNAVYDEHRFRRRDPTPCQLVVATVEPDRRHAVDDAGLVQRPPARRSLREVPVVAGQVVPLRDGGAVRKPLDGAGVKMIQYRISRGQSPLDPGILCREANGRVRPVAAHGIGGIAAVVVADTVVGPADVGGKRLQLKLLPQGLDMVPGCRAAVCAGVAHAPADVDVGRAAGRELALQRSRADAEIRGPAAVVDRGRRHRIEAHGGLRPHLVQFVGAAEGVVIRRSLRQAPCRVAYVDDHIREGADVGAAAGRQPGRRVGAAVIRAPVHGNIVHRALGAQRRVKLRLPRRKVAGQLVGNAVGRLVPQPVSPHPFLLRVGGGLDGPPAQRRGLELDVDLRTAAPFAVRGREHVDLVLLEADGMHTPAVVPGQLLAAIRPQAGLGGLEDAVTIQVQPDAARIVPLPQLKLVVPRLRRREVAEEEVHVVVVLVDRTGALEVVVVVEIQTTVARTGGQGGGAVRHVRVRVHHPAVVVEVQPAVVVDVVPPVDQVAVVAVVDMGTPELGHEGVGRVGPVAAPGIGDVATVVVGDAVEGIGDRVGEHDSRALRAQGLHVVPGRCTVVGARVGRAPADGDVAKPAGRQLAPQCGGAHVDVGRPAVLHRGRSRRPEHVRIAPDFRRDVAGVVVVVVRGRRRQAGYPVHQARTRHVGERAHVLTVAVRQPGRLARAAVVGTPVDPYVVDRLRGVQGPVQLRLTRKQIGDAGILDIGVRQGRVGRGEVVLRRQVGAHLVLFLRRELDIVGKDLGHVVLQPVPAAVVFGATELVEPLARVVVVAHDLQNHEIVEPVIAHVESSRRQS